jgi:hypothetical protein
MSREELDRRLEALHTAVDRIGQNLVELEVDSTRELLEATKLDGESAEEWASASANVIQLWQSHGLLQAHLERATKLRDGRRFDELEALLSGQTIELGSTDVPLGQRTLLGESQLAERCSAEQLMQRMSSSFDDVKRVLARIGGAWETLIPRLDDVRRQLAECRQLAAGVGEGARHDLESAGVQLDLLTTTRTSDPLAVEPGAVDRLAHSIAEIRADLHSIAVCKSNFEDRLSDARLLAERVRAQVEAGRAAHAELLVKIAEPAAPAGLELREDPGAKLATIAQLSVRGAWREACRELEQWTTCTASLLDEAQRIVRANKAPIESRNQFRALLDAYEVKAKHLGMVEDSELTAVYAQAHEALYTAPTDLSLLGRLVRRYQNTLNGTVVAEEELR